MLSVNAFGRSSYCLAGFLVAVVIVARTGTGQTEQQPHSMSTGSAANAVVAITDGAVDPSKIPDDIAFMHFFRVLAKDPRAMNEQADEARRRSYLKYFFTKSCGPGQDDRSLTDTETAALLDFANPVSIDLAATQKASTGNAQVTSSAWPISSATSAAVLAAAASLDSELGPEVARKVRAHVADHMKPAIKIVQSQIQAK